MKLINFTLRIKLSVFITLTILVLSIDAPKAGSQLGELEYKYPCTYFDERFEIITRRRNDSATVGVEFNDRGEPPVIMMNERESREQPTALVTFEYFSACQLARRIRDLQRSGQPIDRLDTPFFRKLIFDSDCHAISRLDKAGLLHSGKSASIILEIFYYERAREQYFGVRFPERADNIQENCPI